MNTRMPGNTTVNPTVASVASIAVLIALSSIRCCAVTHPPPRRQYTPRCGRRGARGRHRGGDGYLSSDDRCRRQGADANIRAARAGGGVGAAACETIHPVIIGRFTAAVPLPPYTEHN